MSYNTPMSIKNYDFIIGYENKIREFESVCLLKYELERRGHSVLYFQEFDQRYDDVHDILYHAKVLIVSAGYEDRFVERFIRRFISFDKLVNWQWEQVFDKSLEEDPNSAVNVKGIICRQAVQLSWGDFNVKRMTELLKLPAGNVFKTGLISTDFVRPEFGKFYKSREEILKEYNISPDYRVAILLGVFQRAFMTYEELEELKAEVGIDFHEISEQNLKRFYIEMDWIRRALKENEDLFFIYRPHPGDEYDRCPPDIQRLLDDIKNETGRFIVNQDYTVRQWFRVADTVYTGFSTTTVDAFFAHKGCYMFSPEGIPVIDEGILFDDVKTIGTYEEFIDTLHSNDFFTPLNEELIDGYYSVSDGLRYPVICDALETVLADDSYIIDTTELRAKINKESEDDLRSKSFAKRLKLKLWKYDFFYNAYWKIMSLPIDHPYFIKQREYKNRIDTYYKSYVGSKKEYKEITSKIDAILNSANTNGD